MQGNLKQQNSEWPIHPGCKCENVFMQVEYNEQCGSQYCTKFFKLLCTLLNFFSF